MRLFSSKNRISREQPFASSRGKAFFVFRGDILRCSIESRTDQGNASCVKINTCRALFSPSASARLEHTWRFAQKHPLLFWGELHHPMFVVGITERGKNLAADPEIRVAYVRGLARPRNVERQTSKLICGPEKVFRLTLKMSHDGWRRWLWRLVRLIHSFA